MTFRTSCIEFVNNHLHEKGPISTSEYKAHTPSMLKQRCVHRQQIIIFDP